MLLGMEVFSEFKGAFTENYVMSQIKSLEKYDGMDNNIFYYSKDSSPLEVDLVVKWLNGRLTSSLKAVSGVKLIFS